MSGHIHIQRWKGNQRSADPGRRVLVLPGAAYPVEMPGLALPMRALALQGWDVWHAAWDMTGRPHDARRRMVDQALDELDAATVLASETLVLAKSIGSLAAGWVADRGCAAIWTTPLMREEWVVSEMARSAGPALLVAGTADPEWDLVAGARTFKKIRTITGADHAWATGHWRREIEVLGELTGAVDQFAGGLI